MKQQLALFAIIFVVMGCNNTPDAQQSSVQQNKNTESAVTHNSDVVIAENVTISENIRKIDQQIADLEKQEKLQLSKEIEIIQQKIADLETRENEIDMAITKLESKIAASEANTKNATRLIADTKAVTQTEPAVEATTNTQTDDSQQVASINPDSVHGWGDWANGIKPAAGPSPVAKARFDVQKPNVNFRPNEHSAFYRTVAVNPPAGPVIPNTPPTIATLGAGDPIPTARPGDRFTR